MFHAIIVEDEEPILELMKVIIGRNPHYTITGAFSDPFEAMAHLPELKPDVAFLDVEMPKMNGLELARRIGELSEQTQIIFTTAYRHYALEAFEVYALDYVLKPVTPAAIERVTERLIKQRRSVAPVEQPMSTSTIRCFGGFEVRNPQGAQIRFPTRNTEELFAYFLCHPAKNISKWHLADLLWPDMTEERAAHNLHNTIYRLKKMLKEHAIGMDIQKTSEGYKLETWNQVYDVLAFQQGASAEGPPDAAQAEQLCSLYKGPLLDRKPYLWKAPLEERYSKQYTALVRRLLGEDLTSEDWHKAELRLDAYLSLYPLHEEMNQLLLDVYAKCGNKEQVARHYARFEAAFRREMGLEPPQEMRNRVSSYLASC